ncbi:HNH endonuclease [Curvivirga aplysinae]|uniref:HNH endonuclease n=1 Tax=Curvivirga aplysinae TaxID=2529852 RepID=UPI0012BC2821|nr:HNH endonuclease [Curvivirga aplysinae]MTI10172.1 HNH endonuclease [Curvivirga aplysinae]
MNFIPGKQYRRKEIHNEFGGSRQGGIANCAAHPFIFIFTGKSGSEFGYDDHWDDDGQFIYCGEGQTGDMKFQRGNLAIRDHAQLGKDIHVFETLGKSKPVRYVGQFACTGWHEDTIPDKNKNMRKGLFFHLIPVNDLVDTDESAVEEISQSLITTKDLNELRDLAISNDAQPGAYKSVEGRKKIYLRSGAVKAYVLARAQGKCEGCGEDAPFTNKKGVPYLEPHHTRRLSDGGPDDPRWVAALCPNCHKEVHYGKDGANYNASIIEKLSQLEAG